jgi:hypothetical protein
MGSTKNKSKMNDKCFILNLVSGKYNPIKDASQ